jgi:hypothetical protein
VSSYVPAVEAHCSVQSITKSEEAPERRRPRTERGQLVGSTMNNSVSRKAPARFNPPRAGLLQTSAWLTRQAPLREHSPVNSNALRLQVAPGPLYSLRGRCPSFDELLSAMTPLGG